MRTRMACAWLGSLTLVACGGSIGGTSDDDQSSAIDAGSDNASCKKIDVVFSVDPSSSMDQELTAMSGDVFPGFEMALRNVNAGLEDFRVGVLDACPNPANFHTRGQNSPDCNFQSGQVWMDSTSTALQAEFGCVGDIYRTYNCTGDNDDEQPASAALTALTPPYSDNENAGFLRDDALLVVVAITDEDEQPTPDKTAEQLYGDLVAVKGDVKKMVFLGIGGGVPNGCSEAPGGVYGTASPATKLFQTTQMFVDQDRGVWWDLCQGHLEDGLTDAIDVISQACDEFVVE